MTAIINNKFVSNYNVVWWIRADQIKEDFSLLARALKVSPELTLSEQQSEVQLKLNEIKRWLICFDNVDKEESRALINPYIPPLFGHVMILSTIKEDTKNNISLDVFETSDSVELLKGIISVSKIADFHPAIVKELVEIMATHHRFIHLKSI